MEKTEKIRLTISVGICIALRGMGDSVEPIGSHEIAYKQDYAIFTHFRGRVSERFGAWDSLVTYAGFAIEFVYNTDLPMPVINYGWFGGRMDGTAHRLDFKT